MNDKGPNLIVGIAELLGTMVVNNHVDPLDETEVDPLHHWAGQAAPPTHTRLFMSIVRNVGHRAERSWHPSFPQFSAACLGRDWK